MVYRRCIIVPSWENTSITARQKTFIQVPLEENRRKLWLEATRPNPEEISTKSGIYVCEDRFNMYMLLFLIVPLCWDSVFSIKTCLQVKLEHERNCLAKDYENYVDCVRTRMKRHSYDCMNEVQCFDCDCDSCSYSECGGQCDECCNSCCSNYVQCHTNHCCHKQCHAECKSYNCRSSCRKSCYDVVSRESNKEVNREVNKEVNSEVSREVIQRTVDRTIIQGSGTNNAQSNTSNTNSHNITTVINLKNVINNTNLIDVPINLNYTNKNNISLSQADQTGGGCSSKTGENCCIVIGPRQCVPIQISPYVRCFHTRSRQCGSYCSASIVHQEPTQICDKFNAFGQPICQQQMAYIPQPKPRCTYTSTWPYVTCGIQPSAECEGCYRHYFNSQAKEYKSCQQQCYDNFGAGPLYRQGPFYQPTYSHMPPCYFSPQGCGGLGGFGGVGGMPNVGAMGVMGAYGGGMGAAVPGFGFGYGTQLPMTQPGFPFSPPVPYYQDIYGTVPNTTIFNQTSFNMSGLLEPEIINQYQSDQPFKPLYDLPGKEVEIEVKITDPKTVKRQNNINEREHVG